MSIFLSIWKFSPEAKRIMRSFFWRWCLTLSKTACKLDLQVQWSDWCSSLPVHTLHLRRYDRIQAAQVWWAHPWRWPCVCQRNCSLLIMNLCNKPYRWDQPGNEDFKCRVCLCLHTCPLMISFALWAVAVFPLRNRPGLCFLVPLIAVHGGTLSFPTREHTHCMSFDAGWRLGLAFTALKYHSPLNLSPQLGFDWIMSSRVPLQWKQRLEVNTEVTRTDDLQD